MVGLLEHFNELRKEDKFKSEARKDKQAVLGGHDAVTIYTWWGAKGLEWPVTILFGLESVREPTATGVHVASEHSDFDATDPLAGRWVRYWPNPYHPASKGPVRDRFEASAEYKELVDKKRRENLRLLYVMWTRARDRLVLAAKEEKMLTGIFGELISIDPNAIDEPETSPAHWAGREVNLVIRPFVPAEPKPASAIPGQTYVRQGPVAHPPAFIAPSSIEASGTTGTSIHLGNPIEVRGKPNPRDLGNAIHAFLASDSPELGADARESIAEGLLTRWGVSANLDPANLIEMSDRLASWIATQWPDGTLHREWPLRHRLADGSVVRGSLDGFIETPATGAVLDHKAIDAGVDESVGLAAEYAGQLGAYIDGIRAATTCSEVRAFIHLPLAGQVVEVHP